MHTVDLHYLKGFEAEIFLQNAIEENFQIRRTLFKVSHGYGSFVLRDITWKTLANSNRVADFHLAPPNLGGAGVTIVKLKTKKD